MKGTGRHTWRTKLLALVLLVSLHLTALMHSTAAQAFMATDGIDGTLPPTATDVSTSVPADAISPTAPPPASDASAGTGGSAGSTYNDNAGGGGGKNIVQVKNHVDNRLTIKGNIQLNRIPGPTAQPINLALAYASCVDCQTLAVALQINLISRTAHRITPENVAQAINFQCLRCLTVAVALQYDYTVDDPIHELPPSVSELIREMDHEFTAIDTDNSLSLPAAVSRIDGIVSRFQDLAASLSDRRAQASEINSPDAMPGGTTATPTAPANSSDTAATTQAPTRNVPATATATPASTTLVEATATPTISPTPPGTFPPPESTSPPSGTPTPTGAAP